MTDSYDFCARPQQFFKFVKQQLALIIDGSNLKLGAFFFAQNLPGHDIRVMLHGSDEHFVSSANLAAPVSWRDQVDGSGCAPNKNDLARTGAIDQSLNPPPGP